MFGIGADQRVRGQRRLVGQPTFNDCFITLAMLQRAISDRYDSLSNYKIYTSDSPMVENTECYPKIVTDLITGEGLLVKCETKAGSSVILPIDGLVFDYLRDDEQHAFVGVSNSMNVKYFIGKCERMNIERITQEERTVATRSVIGYGTTWSVPMTCLLTDSGALVVGY